MTQKQCEMCGQMVPFTKKIRIEGTMMDVCSKCTKFGDEIGEKKPKKPTTPPVVAKRLERRTSKPLYKDVFESQDTGDALVDDYPTRITKARNSKNLTKKELAVKINEKLSVIHSLERGELHPDDALVKKLEKELGIHLKEKIKDLTIEKKAYSQGLTLGDFLKTK